MQVLGYQQSPIQILTADSVPVVFGHDYLKFDYDGELDGLFKGDNFEFSKPSPGEDDTRWSITVGGRRWIIRKIHIHAPAEHKIDSVNPQPYEAHLLHSAASDPDAKADKLVIAVFIVPHAKAGVKKSLTELNRLLSQQKSQGGASNCQLEHKLDPGEFIPDAADRKVWFAYEGSLTSWPYSEDVSWIVFKEAVRVPLGEFGSIAECAEQEERPVFPLNRRHVLRNVPAARSKASKG
ncbi:carbonic anhydrase family protein [Tundrisphaera lichenicola]|uniref:carbonic anhydrase family protein n=1 Tax=Tundrisphaera lichenicola TaxID=2029860 RepID=UPI003EBBFE21